MTNELTTTNAVALEHVLGTGDLSKLSTQQRVDYYLKVCETIGVNPATRPFRFMQFQGQTTLYATRDCADQLRALRDISITIPEKRLEDDVLMVTARAQTPNGRSDEDVGAVLIGNLRGEAKANAVMKAITKAKRRVTLSICGLGFLDESEVETLDGAKTFDHDAPAAEVAPLRLGKSKDFITEATEALENEPNVQKWLKLLEEFGGRVETTDHVAALYGLPSVTNGRKNAPTAIKGIIEDILRKAAMNVATPQEEQVSGQEVAASPGDRSTNVAPSSSEPGSGQPSKEDWEIVLDTMQSVIRYIEDIDLLDEWRKDNAATIKRLKKEAPSHYARLIEIMDERRIALSS